MPKSSPLQSNFNTGEFSPRLLGRVDADRYKQALALGRNVTPLLEGALVHTPGTYFVNAVKTSSKETILQGFEFSTVQAYMLEFGDLYVRFYKDHAVIESAPATPVEVVTPYLEADLYKLKFVQSADVLYITHPSYKPRKLTRTSHTAWSLTAVDFLDGPYLPTNVTATTLSPSATSGSITVTASSTTGINGGSGFQTTDIGRVIRLKTGGGGAWAWGEITARASTTSITVNIRGGTLGGTTATTTWRLGVYSDTTGWPRCAVFHEDRLGFAGATSNPNRADLSNSGDYENFAPSDLTSSASVSDSNAVPIPLNDRQMNAIYWMTSDEKGLLLGTAGGPWVAKPSAQTEIITPTNITARKATADKCADIAPIQSGKATIFVGASKRVAREFTYFYDADGFRANNLSRLSDHIFKGGVVQCAYQEHPQPMGWFVRGDGQLATMVYERDSETLRAGWTRQVFGGIGQGNGSGDDHALIRSVGTISTPDGTSEEAWFIVKRLINNTVVRSIEYMKPFFTEETEQRDAFFVNCGLTHDSPVTITGITAAVPPVVTAALHPYVNGEEVMITDVNGYTGPNGDNEIESRVNNKRFFVKNAGANDFELADEDGNDIDFGTTSPYVSGGKARKIVTTVQAAHLPFCSVALLIDGAPYTATADVSGNVSLPDGGGAVIHMGFQRNADAQLLRLEAGAADGTALGKVKRTNNLSLLVDRTAGLKAGMSFGSSMVDVTIEGQVIRTGEAVPLYTGITGPDNIEANYDKENQICIRQQYPLPFTLLAVMPQLNTQDR